jgi:hypothetical protein
MAPKKLPKTFLEMQKERKQRRRVEQKEKDPEDQDGGPANAEQETKNAAADGGCGGEQVMKTLAFAFIRLCLYSQI